MLRCVALPAPEPCDLDAAVRAAARVIDGVTKELGDRAGALVPGFLTTGVCVAVSAIGFSAILPTRSRAHFPLSTAQSHTSSDPRTDENLVVAHRAGDASALRILVERYKGELHGFLTRLVGSRVGADDVFQEAFLQVHLSADSFDEERRFKPWLYTIAANKGRDFLRRQKRRSAVSLDAPVGSSGDAALVDLLGGSDLAPASSLEASDEATIIKVVVDELPGHFREILLLSYFQKMSYAQISDSLSIPLGTVKSRLHAAVACFAESWKIACVRRGIRVDAASATSSPHARQRGSDEPEGRRTRSER
jgi:RNA polymerase sigma-70 factor (ECF subfamily)